VNHGGGAPCSERWGLSPTYPHNSSSSHSPSLTRGYGRGVLLLLLQKSGPCMRFPCRTVSECAIARGYPTGQPFPVLHSCKNPPTGG
jgi:hypothetical protein